MSITTGMDGWNPDWALHPGEHLAEYIGARGWTQAEFARLAGLSPKLVSTIVSGRNPITADTAIRIERVLGVKAYIWTTLQGKWDVHVARENENNRIDMAAWLARFPIKDLKARGQLPNTKDPRVLADSLMSLLGVGTPSAYEQKVACLAVHHRQSRSYESSKDHVFAWLLMGETRAQSMNLPAFDQERFIKAVKSIRALTVENPQVFEPQMKAYCRDAGVALIFEKPLPKTCLFGSARWLDNNRAIIQMSLRMKTNDHFWWTFFHEAAHIVLHQGQNFMDDKAGEGDGVEAEADAWANKILFGDQGLHDLLGSRVGWSEREIKQHASSLKLHPGIVVGALQHHKKIEFSKMNWLKVRFDWAEKKPASSTVSAD